MKLITKEIERALEASPLYAHDGKDESDVPVIVKFFNAFGKGTWYVTEAERIDSWTDGSDYRPDDWMFFGVIKGVGDWQAEIGYMFLSELKTLPGLERDLHWSGTLADAKQAEARW